MSVSFIQMLFMRSSALHFVVFMKIVQGNPFVMPFIVILKLFKATLLSAKDCFPGGLRLHSTGLKALIICLRSSLSEDRLIGCDAAFA